MLDASTLSKGSNAAVVAPAGHGKTELIGNIALLGKRALVLTHTHAGVHAIRQRMKRLGVAPARASVDTIAGWCLRYAHAFPGVSSPPDGMPNGQQEWEQLYRGVILALKIGAIREVVASSYDRILIDEYQDCHALPHGLAIALSAIVPTIVFGDPMQGIFEFAGPTISWQDEIHPAFPLAGTLEIPHRWGKKNPDLGAWIAETRVKLERGEQIDLASGPITYRQCDDAFDMDALNCSIGHSGETHAAIHCDKQVCYTLARKSRGAYQAIEEMAANRLQGFARASDTSLDQRARLGAIKSIMEDCFHKRIQTDVEQADPHDQAITDEMNSVAISLSGNDCLGALRQLLSLARKRPNWRLFREEIWRDAERAANEVDAGRATDMRDAVASIRQRTSSAGRVLPHRTVSTPLLLKGLEFDHVVIPDGTHFRNQRYAHAKLFYVAISRATRSLTISSPNRFLQFPLPKI